LMIWSSRERNRCLESLVDAFVHRFNHYRHHEPLDGKAPAEDVSSLSHATSPSHMS
jgi:hypothetical protein